MRWRREEKESLDTGSMIMQSSLSNADNCLKEIFKEKQERRCNKTKTTSLS